MGKEEAQGGRQSRSFRGRRRNGRCRESAIAIVTVAPVADIVAAVNVCVAVVTVLVNTVIVIGVTVLVGVVDIVIRILVLGIVVSVVIVVVIVTIVTIVVVNSKVGGLRYDKEIVAQMKDGNVVDVAAAAGLDLRSDVFVAAAAAAAAG